MSYHTDPACSASWAAEPRLRRLMVEFGADMEITYVMGGLAREFEDPPALAMTWLGHAAESGMPVDPRVWAGDPPRSSYPACIAFTAAAEQGPEAAERYLRALREGFMCHGRKLDGPEALVEEARRAGLDVRRFRIDLESNAILERFGGGPRGVAHDHGGGPRSRPRHRGEPRLERRAAPVPGAAARRRSLGRRRPFL